MTTGAIAADAIPLTIDQAVANLDAADKKENEAPAEAAQTETPNTEADPAAEDAEGPETATEGENAETEDGAAEEESEQPAIEPPRFWNAEAKKRFGELPRDLQELVLAKDAEGVKAVALKFEEAAKLRQAAEAEASKIAPLVSKLDKLIPEAEQTFASRWGTAEIDWNAVATEQGVDKAFQLKNLHDRELASMQQLKAAKQEVEAAETQKFVAARFEELKSLVPELGDAKSGPAKQLELVNYISANYDVPVDVIVRQATAKQLQMAHKAYLYDKLSDQAQVSASAPKPQAKPAAAPKPSVKPTAAPGRSGSPQSQRIQQLQRKPSLTTDELVELMDLQGA